MEQANRQLEMQPRKLRQRKPTPNEYHQTQSKEAQAHTEIHRENSMHMPIL